MREAGGTAALILCKLVSCRESRGHTATKCSNSGGRVCAVPRLVVFVTGLQKLGQRGARFGTPSA